MKAKLIVAGGFAVAALFGMAGTASASGYGHSERCDLSTDDDSTALRITPWGVFAGHRDAEACEHRRDYGRPHDGDNWGFWPGRGYWPGGWAYGMGVGMGVGL
ncbi:MULTISPECIES: hypothetical protein [unclassified Nonomuraea]|uniref:hypothetical protein n=1 Tax=Nonomuraea sp. NPDC047529 TaxID=3155623 RepID=UPI0033F430CE